MDQALTNGVVEIAEKAAEAALPALTKKVLGFLSGSKPRKAKERSAWERRGTQRARRVSGVAMRLREGFWMEYHRRSGAGRTEPIEKLRFPEVRRHIFQAFVTEARHYTFCDRTSRAPVEPATIVDAAIDVAWARWSAQPAAARHSCALIHGIAEDILLRYNVVQIDRRETQRRARASA